MFELRRRDMKRLILIAFILCSGCGRYALQSDVSRINRNQLIMIRALVKAGVVTAEPVKENDNR